MDRNDVVQLLGRHDIAVTGIKQITGSFNKDIFLINNDYVLRPSLQEMRRERENYIRIGHLARVPKICQEGEFLAADTAYQYLLLTLLPGADLIDAIPGMTKEQQDRLGSSVAAFLNDLHAIPGDAYDIGHYVPLVPDRPVSWKAGHETYRGYLQENAAGLGVGERARRCIDEALRYLRSRADALDFQSGPVLLHNDFHPKNIIVRDGAFSGVIDWECSQFGEADFDLCHLIHWCLFPPKPDADFRPFLRSLFHASPKCVSVPDIAERLTIYQIEHELIQLIWSGGKSEDDRVRRLGAWLEDSVGDLLRFA